MSHIQWNNANTVSGSPSVATHNAWDIPLANFTVFPGDNHIHRPEGGSKVESGALKNGEVEHTNLTLNTETGEWKVIGFEKMFLDYKIVPDLTDLLKGVIPDDILEQLDEAGILDPIEDLLSDLIGSAAPGSGSGGGEGDDEGGPGIEDMLSDLMEKLSEAGGDFEKIKEALEGLLS